MIDATKRYLVAFAAVPSASLSPSDPKVKKDGKGRSRDNKTHQELQLVEIRLDSKDVPLRCVRTGLRDEDSQYYSKYQPAAEFLANFGVCGKCAKSYRLFNGQAFGMRSKEKKDLESQLEETRTLVLGTQKRKQEARASNLFDRVMECNLKLRDLRKVEALLRHKLEPVQDWCPYCGA